MKSAVPSNVRPRIQTIPDLFKKIQSYDVFNDYPQKIENAIASSGTAFSCSDKLAKFLIGDGYADQKTEDLVINENGETLGMLHKMECIERSKFDGVYFIVGKNAMYEVTSIHFVPVAFVRFGLIDPKTKQLKKMAVHPNWTGENGQAFKMNEIQWYDVYTSDSEETTKQIVAAGGFEKWNGQIFYSPSSGQVKYPKAVCDSVLEDVLTDRGVKVYKYRWLETGCLPDGMVVTIGAFADGEEEKFNNNLKKFQGADRSNRMIHVNADTKETAPSFIPIEDGQKDKKFELTEHTVKTNIIGAYSQPLSLHGLQSSSPLGSIQKEFEQSRALYEDLTANDRRKMGELFKEVLKYWHEGDLSNMDFAVKSLAGSAQIPLEDRFPDFINKVVSLAGSTLPAKIKRGILMKAYRITEAEALEIFPDDGTGLPN
jgi:hypothetical protein